MERKEFLCELENRLNKNPQNVEEIHDLIIQELEKIEGHELQKEEELSKMYNEYMSKFLLECGISPKLKGYSYLIAAVELRRNLGIYSKITKDIYPKIAKQFNVPKIIRIERGIRYAIKIAYDLKTDTWIEVFGDVFPKQPTNSTVIDILVKHIRDKF